MKKIWNNVNFAVKNNVCSLICAILILSHMHFSSQSAAARTSFQRWLADNLEACQVAGVLTSFPSLVAQCRASPVLLILAAIRFYSICVCTTRIRFEYHTVVLQYTCIPTASRTRFVASNTVRLNPVFVGVSPLPPHPFFCPPPAHIFAFRASVRLIDSARECRAPSLITSALTWGRWCDPLFMLWSRSSVI